MLKVFARRSDDWDYRRKVFNMEAKYVTPVDERTRKARLEAAAKLGRNHRRVLDDILKNSGILRVSNFW